jgi:hypothetical protein
MSLEERRRSERFNCGVPLTVEWTNGSERRLAHAITQDVSSGGMYFLLPEAIPDGTPVESALHGAHPALRPEAGRVHGHGYDD